MVGKRVLTWAPDVLVGLLKEGEARTISIEQGLPKDAKLTGIDWDSGKSRVVYKLGNSVKFFPWNNMVVAPNGAVDLFNWLGMGIMRMQPKK